MKHDEGWKFDRRSGKIIGLEIDGLLKIGLLVKVLRRCENCMNRENLMFLEECVSTICDIS